MSKLNKSIKFIFLVTLFFSTQTYAKPAVSDSLRKRTIQSKEEYYFHPKKDVQLLSWGQIPQYVGQLERVNPTLIEMKRADVFYFESEKSKVSQEYCKTVVQQIWGLETSQLYEIKAVKEVMTAKGTACLVQVGDKKSIQEVKKAQNLDLFQRLALVGFLNAQSTVLVFKLQQINQSHEQEALRVWDNLR